MYIPDLGKYASSLDADSNSLIAVGWLAGDAEFKHGSVPVEFSNKLAALCRSPIRLSRGTHACPFCRDATAKGNGEVRVEGLGGTIFVAPSLIAHYVTAHNYCPPREFIDAVRAMKRNLSDEQHTSLARAIIQLADSPGEVNKSEFYRALCDGRVGVRVEPDTIAVPSGEYVTNSQRNLRIPLATSPAGDPMLLVLCNIEWLAANDLGSTFVELAGFDALTIAKESRAGIIVQVPGPRRQAWGGISKREVESALTHGNRN